jgi:hemolysin III
MPSATVEAPGRPARPLLRGWLHLIGGVLLVVSSPLLVLAASGASRWAAAVYVLGVGAMLAVSATYHVPAWGPAAKRGLRRADHSAIFLGIAGTYTPVLVVATDGGVRVGLLVGVWCGAVAGIVLRNVVIDARPWLVATPYVVLGWVSVALLPALVRLSTAVTVLVIAGGLAYTLGAVVYARKRPDPWPRVFGFHELFHALTLVAIALHWAAVLLALRSGA